MSIMKSLVVGACALSVLVQARPVPDVIVTEIVTQTTWTTVDCTTTVWLPYPESSAPAPDSTAGQSKAPVSATSPEETTTPPPAPTPQPPTTIPTTPLAPSTSAAPVTTTPAYTPPAVTTTQAPAPVVTTTQAPAPAPTTTTTTTQAPAPAPAPTTTTTTTTQAPAPAPQTTSSAQPVSAAPSSAPGNFVQASASNSCEGTSSACEGEITHWDGGLGACGWDVSTDSDMSVALPVGLMGSMSNGNPYCGRSITIHNPTSGTTVQAKVGDKCMGCTGRSIDLTNKLFKAVTDGTGDGRESGFQWWFSD